MALIRKDCHGLYVKCGGYIARPVPTEYTRHDNVAEDTEYCAGDNVLTRHIGGSCQHKVGEGKNVEFWSSHGAYIVPDWENDTVRTLNSEECWEPAG